MNATVQLASQHGRDGRYGPDAPGEVTRPTAAASALVACAFCRREFLAGDLVWVRDQFLSCRGCVGRRPVKREKFKVESTEAEVNASRAERDGQPQVANAQRAAEGAEEEQR